MLKSNFLDNRLPKRKKNDFYSIIVSLIALYRRDSHLNAASFDPVWMHGDTALLPLPACPLPHSSQTAFVCSCRDAPGAVVNQTATTVWFSTGLLTLMIESAIFTTRHVHVSAFRPNQTRSRGRTGSIRKPRRHSPYWIVNCVESI